MGSVRRDDRTLRLTSERVCILYYYSTITELIYPRRKTIVHRRSVVTAGASCADDPFSIRTRPPSARRPIAVKIIRITMPSDRVSKTHSGKYRKPRKTRVPHVCDVPIAMTAHAVRLRSHAPVIYYSHHDFGDTQLENRSIYPRALYRDRLGETRFCK